MADRTDIDALLIGALYGELTAADEARLTAHLESHPADRTALADMTRTRAAVRDSRLLAFQVDPPQGISALLLREASRRAPRLARESAGWFQRFIHSFAAHPAMAAAATLVLVVGVAGTLYLRGEDQIARPTASSVAPLEPSVTAPGEPPPPAMVEPSPEPKAEPAGQQPDDRPDEQKNTGSVGAGSAGPESYRVGLDEGTRAPARRRAEATEGDTTSFKFDGAEAKPRLQKQTAKTKARKGDALLDIDSEPAQPAKLAKKPAAIEVRTPQPMPKDLRDDDEARGPAKREAGGGGATSANEQARVAPSAPAAGAPAPAATTSPTTPPAPAPAPADRVLDQAPAAPPPQAQESPALVLRGGDARKAPAKPAPSVARPPSATPPSSQAVAPVAPGAADPVGAGRADKGSLGESKVAKPDEKSVSDDKNRDKASLAWARKQHDQVIALVSASNCRAAANVAGEIYSRAPGYYAANIVTDRSIRPCLSYLNSERDRQDRSRAAAKRANRADEATDSRK